MRSARWLALGDSYTAGEGVAAAARWPLQAAALLRAEGLPVAEPQVLARTGWTADELSRAMEEAGVWPPTERHDAVSLLVGVNDQYRGRPLAQFAPAFADCLERAVALAGAEPARVLVVSIPDWGVTPFASARDRAGIAREIDAYNAHVREVASACGAHWGDVTALSRSGESGAAALAPDGLHPAATAYAAWAARLAPLVRRALAALPPQP